MIDTATVETAAAVVLATLAVTWAGIVATGWSRTRGDPLEVDIPEEDLTPAEYRVVVALAKALAKALALVFLLAPAAVAAAAAIHLTL